MSPFFPCQTLRQTQMEVLRWLRLWQPIEVCDSFLEHYDKTSSGTSKRVIATYRKLAKVRRWTWRFVFFVVVFTVIPPYSNSDHEDDYTFTQGKKEEDFLLISMKLHFQLFWGNHPKRGFFTTSPKIIQLCFPLMRDKCDSLLKDQIQLDLKILIFKRGCSGNHTWPMSLMFYSLADSFCQGSWKRNWLRHLVHSKFPRKYLGFQWNSYHSAMESRVPPRWSFPSVDDFPHWTSRYGEEGCFFPSLPLKGMYGQFLGLGSPMQVHVIHGWN